MSSVQQRRQTTALDAAIIAFLYRRVSSKDQSRKGLSLPTQTAEVHAYVRGKGDHGWLSGAEFEDVQSGRRSDRTGYQAMLAAVRAEALRGRRVVIVLVALDRLGRDLEEGVRAWNELKALGVEIHAVRHGGLITELMFNMYMTMAQEEARRIGERVLGAWAQLHGKGWHRPGRPAWGYTYRPRTDAEMAAGAPKGVLVPEETERAYATELWTRYANGDGAETLVRWAAGLPDAATGGRRLRSSAIREILALPVYVGRLGGRHDLAACVEAGDACPVLAQAPGRWDALISDATWMAAHRQYGRSRRVAGQASGEYLLSGLIRCPKCGSKMVGNPGNRKRAERDNYRGDPDDLKRYVCASRLLGDDDQRADPCYATVMAKKVDPVVIGTVAEMLECVADRALRPKLREHYRQQTAARRAADPANRVAGLEAKAAEASKMLSKVSQLFLDGGMTRLAYDATVADLTEQVKKLSDEAERLQAQQRRGEPEPVELLVSLYAGWAESFADAEVLAQRAALTDLVGWVKPVAVGTGRALRYELEVELTTAGRRLLSYACAALPSENLVAIEQLGTTNWWTAPQVSEAQPLALAI